MSTYAVKKLDTDHLLGKKTVNPFNRHSNVNIAKAMLAPYGCAKGLPRHLYILSATRFAEAQIDNAAADPVGEA
jgi:hypothetical protein